MAHLNLGTTPADERCAQVGTDGYYELARSQCRRHIEVLRAFYIAERGALPEGLKLKIKTFAHDFGDYYEVIAEFDDNDEQAVDAALWLDNNRPAEWPETDSVSL